MHPKCHERMEAGRNSVPRRKAFVTRRRVRHHLPPEPVTRAPNFRSPGVQLFELDWVRWRAMRMACALALSCAAMIAQQTAPVTNLGPDANGNPRRLALKTGHVSNYDEARVGEYTLPDPLVLANGTRVGDAAPGSGAASRDRPPLRDRRSSAACRPPRRASRGGSIDANPRARDGTSASSTSRESAVAADAPRIRLTLYTPANTTRRVPVILLMNFGGGTAPAASVASSGEPPVAARDPRARLGLRHHLLPGHPARSRRRRPRRA